MRASDWELTEPSGEVTLAEGLWVAWVKAEQLLHVEDLDTVYNGFGANDNVVAECSNFSPSRADRVVLWQATQVDHLTLAGDLNKGRSIELANGDKFASRALVCPSPRRISLTLSTTKLSMRQEVVQVNLVMDVRNSHVLAGQGLPTLLHWKVLFASPGIAAAIPSTHLV